MKRYKTVHELLWDMENPWWKRLWYRITGRPKV